MRQPMHSPHSALTFFLFGLSGLFLIVAASQWAKLAAERERPNERPAIPVARFRSAAGVTAASLGLLGIALLWFALTLLG